MTTATIDAPIFGCVICNKPLEGDSGVIAISQEDLRTAIYEDVQAKATRKFAGNGIVVIGRNRVEPARWQAVHDRCGGEAVVARPYAIRSGQLATWREIARWTIHLSRKRWFRLTNWASFLDEAGTETER